MEDRALVFKQPNWTRRTRALFRRLDASPALQAEFLNDPRAALAQTFDVAPPAGVQLAVSAENRILHALLSDPGPRGPESAEDAYAPVYRAISNLEANLNAQQQTQLDFQFETTASTHFGTALHAQVHAQLAAHTHASVKLSVQLEAGIGADAGGTARAAVNRLSRLDLQKVAGFIASRTTSRKDLPKTST